MCLVKQTKILRKLLEISCIFVKENGSREQFTTDQVLTFLLEDDHTKENAGSADKTLDDYLRVILTDSEDDRSGAVEVSSTDSNDSNSSESDGERSNAERRAQKIMQGVLHLAYLNPDCTESVLSG